MKTTTTFKVINQQLVAGSQSVDLTLDSGKTKLRVSQCHARVERWDGAKWQEVAHLRAAAMQTKEGLVYLPNKSGVSLRHFEADLKTLLDLASQILGLVAR
jgi:hypothetical protein